MGVVLHIQNTVEGKYRLKCLVQNMKSDKGNELADHFNKGTNSS